jgi:hypothetical protein
MSINIIPLKYREDRLAVLKDELLIQEITEYRIWSGIPDTESSCRGICRAHKEIIEWARNERLPEVLIAEDDVHFTAPGAFNYYLEKKPAYFDIYLGGITWGKISPDNLANDFSGVTLYTIHQRFYSILLAQPENVPWDRGMAGPGRFVVCDPMIVVQHSGYSDNQKRYIDFGPLIRRKKWLTG